MTDIEKALEDYKFFSAKLSCGSSSCPHSRDKGGQMVNGPCRCYPISNPYREYVFAAGRLAKLVREQEKEKSWVCPLNDPNCKSNCGNYGCGN